MPSNKAIGSNEIESNEIESTEIRASGFRHIGSKANALEAESMPLNHRLKLTAPSGSRFLLGGGENPGPMGNKRAPRAAA